MNNITFISAGAGSGKTYKLTELIKDELRKGSDPSHIIATTFTVKAAGEIKNRVKEKLLSSGDHDLASKADTLRIGTVNGICGELLGEFSFEAGLSPGIAVASETESYHLLEQSIASAISEDVLQELGRLDRRFGYTKGLRYGSQEPPFREFIKDVIDAARRYIISPKTLPVMAQQNADALLSEFGAALTDSRNALADLIEDLLPGMIDINAEKAVKKTAEYIDLCKEAVRQLRGNNFSWNLWVKLERGGGGAKVREYSEQIALEAGTWKHQPALHADIRRYLELVFTSAVAVMESFAESKREAGLIDFTDQQVLLYQILTENPSAGDVRNRLSEHLDVLLVDEFQDTSPIQLALFLELSELSTESWWIGDVKQAIYGFRGGDSDLMEQTLSWLEGSGHKPEVLPTSWRSRAELVHLVNDIFIPAMEDELPQDRIRLEPDREKQDFPAFEHWLLNGRNAENRDAQLIKGLEELLDSGRMVKDKETKEMRPLKYQDIAVLCRSNKRADSLRSIATGRGLPVNRISSGLLDTPEALLVTASLRRLYDRNDTLASAEILGLSQGLSPEDWLEERLYYIETEKKDSWKWRTEGEAANPLLALIEELRETARRATPMQLVDRLIARGELDRIITSWCDDAETAMECLANLEALREIIASFEQEHAGSVISLSSCLLYLQELKAEETDKTAEPMNNGITFLTWHGAKGLEWPVVLFADTENDMKSGVWNQVSVMSSRQTDIRDLFADKFIRLWPWPFGDTKKVSSLDINSQQDVQALHRKSIREEKRLLYVGMTRARDCLIVPVKGIPKTSGAYSENASFRSLGATAAERYITNFPGQNEMRLQNGETVPYVYKEIEMQDDQDTGLASNNGGELKWFDTEVKPGEFPPLIITPSSGLKDKADPKPDLELKTINYDLNGVDVPPLVSHTDLRDTGTEYHNAFAFWACNPESLMTGAYSTQYLSWVKAGVEGISSLFPGGTLSTEVILNAETAENQIITARLDLLIETQDAYHIVDHKLTKDPVEDIEEFARSYYSQLFMYKRAVESVATKPVRGLWLHLPREGRLVGFGGI